MRTLGFALAGVLAIGSAAADQAGDETENLSQKGTLPMLGIAWARDVVTRQAVNPDAAVKMTFHGGKIMDTVVSKAIFWGVKWGRKAYRGDKVTGLDLWYQGHVGSTYAHTVDEYTGINGQVGSDTLIHQGHVIDTSAAVRPGQHPEPILDEVCKQITAGKIVVDLDDHGYYPVYTDLKRRGENYCAWHSAGTCDTAAGPVHVQFAFFFDLAGDGPCEPEDTSGLHSPGLAALANVTGHELEEARSDPGEPGGWYDAAYQENGDKCAWTFAVPLVTFTNGTQWRIQGEWSNAAFAARSGYANGSGKKGCLAGA